MYKHARYYLDNIKVNGTDLYVLLYFIFDLLNGCLRYLTLRLRLESVTSHKTQFKRDWVKAPTLYIKMQVAQAKPLFLSGAIYFEFKFQVERTLNLFKHLGVEIKWSELKAPVPHVHINFF